MEKLLTVIILSSALTVAACASPVEHTVPNSSIKAANGIYFTPLSNPVDGCQAYRQIASAGQMVIQVIYYKHSENEFSPIREDAICD